MNFFSVSNISNALQAVGNVIAPLPEGYEDEDADIMGMVSELTVARQTTHSPSSESTRSSHINTIDVSTMKSDSNDDIGDDTHDTASVHYLMEPTYDDSVENENCAHDEDAGTVSVSDVEGSDNGNEVEYTIHDSMNGVTNIVKDTTCASKTIIKSEENSVDLGSMSSPSKDVSHDSIDHSVTEEAKSLYSSSGSGYQANHLQIQYDKLLRVCEEKSHTISDLESSLETQKRKTVSAFSEISSLSNDLRECLRNNSQLQSSLAEASEQRDILKQQLATSETRCGELITELELYTKSQLDLELKSQYDAVSSRLRQAMGELEQYETQRREWDIEKGALEDQIVELKANSKKLEHDHAALRQSWIEAAEWENQCTSLESQLHRVTEECGSWKSQAEELEVNLREVYHLVKETQEKVKTQDAALKAKELEAEEEVNKLRNRCYMLEEEKASIKSQLEAAEGRIHEILQADHRLNELNASYTPLQPTESKEWENVLEALKRLLSAVIDLHDLEDLESPPSAEPLQWVDYINGISESFSCYAASRPSRLDDANSKSNLKDVVDRMVCQHQQEVIDLRCSHDDVVASLQSQLEVVKADAATTAAVYEENIASLQNKVELLSNELKSLHKQHEIELRSEVESMEKDIREKDMELSRLTSLTKDYETVCAKMDSVTEENKTLKQKQLLLESLPNQAEVVSNQKKQIHKLEVETRQLHQVIAQLRNARRNNQETVDSALADRQSQSELLERQKQEIVELKDSLEKLRHCDDERNTLNSEVVRLRDVLSSIRSEYDNKLMHLEQMLVDTQQELSDANRTRYDVESQLEATISDFLIAKQDLSLKSAELENLHRVISGIEKEKTAAIKRSEEGFDERVKKLKQEWVTRLDELREEHEGNICMIRKQLVEAKLRIQDEELLRRKMEIDMTAEKKKMHKTLENALSQLQNSQEDCVDRVLVKNLIVTYFQQKRSMEVLELIAKVLGFTESDRVTTGLQVASGSLLGSLFQSFASPLKAVTLPSPKPVDIEGENLAEMWLNFLIHESDGNAASDSQKPNPPTVKPIPDKPTSPSMSSVSLSRSGSSDSERSAPLSPRRSYTSLSHHTLTGTSAPPSGSRRMTGIRNVPIDISIPPAVSPSRSNTSSPGDPTAFKLVPQSPVFSPSLDGGNDGAGSRISS